MKLTENHAKDIVDQVMEVIPYNINIMNEKGMIIASGDKKRIGEHHKGAVRALEKEESIEIYKSGRNAKSGINIPIFFQEEPIGVIGITGQPDLVRPFGELVRVMVELLVNQDYMLNQENIRKEQMEEFLYELAYKSDSYSKRFIERGLLLGIDISLPRIAVVLKFTEDYRKLFEKSLIFILKDSEYYLSLDPETIILFIEDGSSSIRELEKLSRENKELYCRIGIGRKQEVLAKSLDEALKAIEIGKKIAIEETIYKYEDLYYFIEVSRFSRIEKFIKINKLLRDKKNLDLLKTLMTYIKYNGEINKVADSLHIHRNTLSYRLEKIKELTGKNPYNYRDLLELFIGSMISEV